MIVKEETGRWLTIGQVAETLQVNVETVRRWVRAGTLPVLNLGSRSGGYRISRTDLDGFIASRYRAATTKGAGQ